MVSLREGAGFAVPFQDEGGRRGCSALVDRNPEGRRADRPFKLAGERMPQAGGSRGDDEPNRRGGGLPHARMTQQEQGMPRRESAAMQALGRSEVERLRTAPNLEQNGGQRVEVRGLFGDP